MVSLAADDADGERQRADTNLRMDGVAVDQLFSNRIGRFSAGFFAQFATKKCVR
jgi:hypothetical protein